MAGNSDPIYSKVGDINFYAQTGLLGPTANTAQDGTGTIYGVFVSDATNGGFIQKLSFQSITTVAATVCRIFIADTNVTLTSGAFASNTAANTKLLNEIGLPAITVSQTAAAPHLELPLNFALPPGFRLGVTFGTSTGASTTGWSIVPIAGKY
jgi:hypothetical protein